MTVTIYRTHEELQFLLSLFYLEAGDDLTDQHNLVYYGQCLMIVRLLRVIIPAGAVFCFIGDVIVRTKHSPKRVSGRKKHSLEWEIVLL